MAEPLTPSPVPILILGHSFVRRLKEDLQSNFDSRADESFNLSDDAIVYMHGAGGRTVKKLRKNDLGAVSSLKPSVIILEIGTNDLVVGSEFD